MEELTENGEQSSRIKELMRENEILRSENAALQRALNEVRGFSLYPNYRFSFGDELIRPQNYFWQQPLERFWNRPVEWNPLAVSDALYPRSLSIPWMAAEDDFGAYPYDARGAMRAEEYSRMEQKVSELKGIIDTLQQKLENVNKPLNYIVEAIKKKALFVNVTAAYNLLQQMNSIFLGYEPWHENVRPLESFLMRERERNNVISSDYSIVPTDEELAVAISSINGNGKVLDEFQKWLGVCCLVQSRYDYPHDMKSCCERLAALPYKTKPQFPCRYENVRKVAAYGFAREDYKYWESYKPKKTEKKYFDSCFDVAKELEKVLGY